MMKPEHIVKAVFILTLTGSFLWAALIFLSPFLQSRNFFLSSWIYELFGSICHQISHRCFHLFGFPMPVCTRCFGIYFGFFLATCCYPKIKGWASLSIPGIWMFAAFSLPIVIDTGGNFIFAWQTSGGIRFLTGLLWGSLLPYYFIPGISEAVLKHQITSGK
jgi:uncharacterized membrane protein